MYDDDQTQRSQTPVSGPLASPGGAVLVAASPQSARHERGVNLQLATLKRSVVADDIFQSSALFANDDVAVPSRRFLIISAPFGAFSRKLAEELRREGADVYRVLLNGGDILDWGFNNARIFSGRQDDWSEWIDSVVSKARITDLITYGDTSFYNKKALKLARARGVRAHILEQGYFRPDWVTVERGGVNANSTLPRAPAWFRNHPLASEPEAAEPIGRTMPSAIYNIVAYHLMMYALSFAFPHFRTGYQFNAVHQTIGHIKRYFDQQIKQLDGGESYRRALGGSGPKFLLLLQRPGDSQLWLHSDFRCVTKLIDKVCENFAANAPKDAQLLIRPHPLDPGVVPHEKNVESISDRLGVSDRVHFSDYGKLHEVLPEMSGVICVNSTGGLAGIEFGVPTITLGQAIYDMGGLTHRGELEQFWTDPQHPDADLYLAFRRVVMAETQVNGAYATAKGQRLAAKGIAKKILGSVDAAVHP